MHIEKSKIFQYAVGRRSLGGRSEEKEGVEYMLIEDMDKFVLLQQAHEMTIEIYRI